MGIWTTPSNTGPARTFCAGSTVHKIDMDCPKPIMIQILKLEKPLIPS